MFTFWLEVFRVVQSDEKNQMACLHKRGLQHDLEGSDGAKRMMLECGFDMSEGECRRLLRRDVRRFAQRVERRPDRALGLVKSLPDAVRCGIAQSAAEVPKSLELIPADHSLLEKRPQAIRSQQEASDLAGEPDAKGSSTASRTIPIATKDAVSADRLFTQMILVVATQDPVADQMSHTSAMRTSLRFQIVKYRLDFLLSTTNLSTHNSNPFVDMSPIRTGPIIPFCQAAKRR